MTQEHDAWTNRSNERDSFKRDLAQARGRVMTTSDAGPFYIAAAVILLADVLDREPTIEERAG